LERRNHARRAITRFHGDYAFLWEALTSEQIDNVIEYVRGFLRNPHWARGELNLPLAQATEKAYPEDEVILRTAVNARGAPGVANEIVFEQPLGSEKPIEVSVPADVSGSEPHLVRRRGRYRAGPKARDILEPAFGIIMSLHGEVIAPTGNRLRGLGTGTTTFGMFGTFGSFPTNTFVQFQGGADLPVHTELAPKSVFWHTAVGQSFVQNTDWAGCG